MQKWICLQKKFVREPSRKYFSLIQMKLSFSYSSYSKWDIHFSKKKIYEKGSGGDSISKLGNSATTASSFYTGHFFFPFLQTMDLVCWKKEQHLAQKMLLFRQKFLVSSLKDWQKMDRPNHENGLWQKIRVPFNPIISEISKKIEIKTKMWACIEYKSLKKNWSRNGNRNWNRVQCRN